MNNIKKTDSSFVFNNLTLSHPTGLQGAGGTYFTKLNYSGEPVYVQSTKCLTKQGIVVTEKKAYCDLMFTNEDEKIIKWFEDLEKNICNLIYNKRKSWFDNDLDLEDIENHFTSPIRVYKSGKFYLVRVNILYNKRISEALLSCYNKKGEKVDADEIKENVKIIPLLEIQGVKFSSRSFQLEMVLKQVMIMEEESNFNSCLINIDTDIVENNNNNTIDKDLLVDGSDNLVDGSDNNLVDGSDNLVDVSDNSLVDGSDNNLVDGSDNLVDVSQNNLIDGSNNELSLEKTDDDELDINDDENSIDNITLSDDDEEGVIKDTTEVKNDNLIRDDSNDSDPSDSEYDSEDNDESNYKYNKNDEYLEEVQLDLDELDNADFKIKNPQDVYFEIWKQSRDKAKKLKRQALEAYLESKKIKSNYMIEDIDNSDDELDDFIDKFVK